MKAVRIRFGFRRKGFGKPIIGELGYTPEILGFLVGKIDSEVSTL